MPLRAGGGGGSQSPPPVSSLHFRRELGGGGHRASGASDKEELPAVSHAAAEDAEPARRTVRGPAAVSDSRCRSALLRSPATSREHEPCPCHLAQASACPPTRGPDATGAAGRTAACSGERRAGAVDSLCTCLCGHRARAWVTLCGWPRCGFA